MPVSDNFVFVDTETTGLDPERHQIWELALIYPHGGAWKTYEAHLPVDLARADPNGLRIGQYYRRRGQLGLNWDATRFALDRWGPVGPAAAANAGWGHTQSAEVAEHVARILDGRHMVGAVPSFDAAFLGRWLRANGQAPTWHYHLVDVEALAAGRLGLEPPWNSDDLSARLGVPAESHRHEALADAEWARAIYRAVMVRSKDRVAEDV